MLSAILMFLSFQQPIVQVKPDTKKFELFNIPPEDRIQMANAVAKHYGRPLTDLIINNVDVFIYDPKTAQYLVAKRDKKFLDGEWFIWGGRQRPGETFFEYATRSTKEELGIDIEPITCIYNYEVVSYNQDGSVKEHINSQVVFALFNSSEFSMPEHMAFYRWIPIECSRNILFSETTYAYFSNIYDKATNYIVNNNLEEKVVFLEN